MRPSEHDHGKHGPCLAPNSHLQSLVGSLALNPYVEELDAVFFVRPQKSGCKKQWGGIANKEAVD